MVEVVVVGAGYAGLSAARRLRAAGLDVVVLEASDRVGGRTLTSRVADGTAVDLGGQWIAAGHTRFAALAEEYDTATFPSHSQGANLLLAGPSRKRYTGQFPPMAPHVTAALGWAMWRLNRLSTRDLTRSQAERLDSSTVATWLRRTLPVPQARRFAELVLGEEMSVDVASVSMLALLRAIRGTGGVKGGIEAESVAELFVDGADGPARAIAAELDQAVRLNTPVTSIEDTGDGVQVNDIHCERVIVAIPPPLAGRITYDPPMPAARDQLTQRMPMGSVLKAFAVYDSPFWRADGLSGLVLDMAGPMIFDASRPDGPGLLCTLIPGRHAQKLAEMGEAARKAEIVGHLVRAFGPQAADPVDWREKIWADDPHCRGGYAAYFPPGVLTSVGAALTAPIGRIHWAGSETATEWAGYIEGAIRSGERAADEVLDRTLVRAGRDAVAPAEPASQVRLVGETGLDRG